MTNHEKQIAYAFIKDAFRQYEEAIAKRAIKQSKQPNDELIGLGEYLVRAMKNYRKFLPIIVICLWLTSCGPNLSGPNNYNGAQNVACQLMNRGNKCVDYLHSLPVTFVDLKYLQSLCGINNPLLSGCFLSGSEDVYIKAGVSNECAVVAHEFIHAIGKHFNDDPDHDHKKYPFQDTYQACKNIGG